MRSDEKFDPATVDQVLDREYGITREELEITQLPNDLMLKVENEDDGNTVEKTCAEWAAEGRGFVGCTVW
jgi:hypothetical protein